MKLKEINVEPGLGAGAAGGLRTDLGRLLRLCTTARRDRAHDDSCTRREACARRPKRAGSAARGVASLFGSTMWTVMRR
jgi:hypothetical protein